MQRSFSKFVKKIDSHFYESNNKFYDLIIYDENSLSMELKNMVVYRATPFLYHKRKKDRKIYENWSHLLHSSNK